MGKLSAEGGNIGLVANAIRSKGGTSSTLKFPTGFVSAITNMSMSSSCVTGSVTVSTNDELTIPVTNLSKIQSLCLIQTDYFTNSKLVLDSVILFMAEDGSDVVVGKEITVTAGAVAGSTHATTSDNRITLHNNLNIGADFVYVTAEEDGIKIMTCYTDQYFRGTYTYYIYGS